MSFRFRTVRRGRRGRPRGSRNGEPNAQRAHIGSGQRTRYAIESRPPSGRLGHLEGSYSFERRPRPPRGRRYINRINATMTTAAMATMATVEAATITLTFPVRALCVPNSRVGSPGPPTRGVAASGVPA
jgi:hypothetical protein